MPDRPVPSTDGPLPDEPLTHDPLAHEALAHEALAHEALAHDPLAHEALAHEALPDEPRLDEPLPDLIWTIPNALSFLRLLGVPLFLWLVLGPHADGWALFVLAMSSLTDYLDGKIARATGKVSQLGALLDPAADRAYIASAVVALAIRDIIPWWLVVALVARDVMLAINLGVLRRRGFGPLPVHFLGKVATFALLYALPLLFLGDGDGSLRLAAREIGWAFTWWGIGLYWWAAVLYLIQTRRLLMKREAHTAVRP